jgi:exodeoxyribonuclease VII large subunit
MDGMHSLNLPEFTVSELAGAVKRTMETSFERVRVRGELGRVTLAKSGHLYADLKDANACVSLVMWRGGVSSLAFRPEEGLEVVAEGRLSTFPAKSQYQLIADTMEPAGVGALMALLEERKRRLAGEGLFDAGRKKPLPFLPSVIGVVTSPSGAVIRDILHRLGERFPRRVLLWPVLVQGEQAAAQVSRAIRGFNALEPGGAVPRPDLIIVARGGGSIEDLWAFNEEAVVRAAAASAIPLISAVGHETDVTLIDFAADRRAPTPTAAAEMAVPVRLELLERVEGGAGRLQSGLLRVLERRGLQLRGLAARLPRAEVLLGGARQRFDRSGERLELALAANARAAEASLLRESARLRPQALRLDLERRAARVEDLGARLARLTNQQVQQRARRAQELAARFAPLLQRALDRQAARLAQSGRMLDSLSHRGVLARGYALLRTPEGGVVRSAGALTAGQNLELELADGSVGVVVGPGGGKKRERATKAQQGTLF